MDGGRGRRKRRHVHALACNRCRRHQHGSRAPRSLRLGRGDERRLLPIRGEHSVLRLCRHVPGSSPSAGARGASARPARHLLRLQPAGRCVRGECAPLARRLDLRCGGAPQGRGAGGDAARSLPASGGPSQRAERSRGDRCGARIGRHRRRHSQWFEEILRREAALHHHGLLERCAHCRRLRPPSGGNRRGAGRGARDDVGPRARRGAAAPLHAPARSVQRILHLLQRRRCRVGRRCLQRRRSADR